MIELADVEVLSLGYTDPRVEVTGKRWWELLRPFSRQAHYHVANLAAHDWDVLLVGERLFLFQTRYGGERGHWVSCDGSRVDATAKEHGQFYTPAKRRRSILRSRSTITSETKEG